MSKRVTRASAARLNADSPAQPSPSTATEPPSPPTQRSTRKRKADAPPPTQRESRRPKKSKGGEEEATAAPATPEGGRKKSKRASAAAMSSAGYADMGQAMGCTTDQDRPSSGTSGETSPQQGPRDSSKRKSSRRKSKEGGVGSDEKERRTTDRLTDPSASASGSTSRKSKKGSKKEKEQQDVQMKDAGEKAEQNEEYPPDPDDEAPPADTGGGADGSDDPMRRFTEEELDAMERSEDPFTSGYFSRFGGGAAGLSSSLRALSGIVSGTHGRLRAILEQLRTKEDPSVQMIALTELSELLLVSNEDNLAGHFAPDQFVKELVTLMQPNEFTGEENPEMMLLACRCIANMMEALPAATASVVYGGAVPILCQKLLEIHYIDLAEQALSTLEKISVEFPSSIVREGGLTACLTYLDFFATSTQRTAVTTAANCCRNIPEESFPTVRDVMPIVLNTLSSSDQRVVEQASLCVSRIVDSFKCHDSKLEELVSPELLKAILRLLLPGSTNMIGQNIHTAFLRVLSTTARASPRLSAELMKMSVVDTLYQILTGVSAPSGIDNAALQIDKNVIMQAIIRTPRDQIFETLNVICEILPSVSSEGLTFLDDLRDAGYVGVEQISMSKRSKNSPNDKRVELLKECPGEVKRFTLILFPTLMHAYTSTVNLGVRQKVLTAQLKMLSNFDTDILEHSLRGVAYASHLASILTQQENHTLVTYALQAAELLLKRMEAIYRPQFYREGVMAEVSKLAARPVKSDTPNDVGAIKAGQVSHPADEVEVLEEHDEDMDLDEEPETIEVDIQPNPDDTEAARKAEGRDEQNDDEDGEEASPDPEPNLDNQPAGEDGEDDDEGSDESELSPSQRPRVMDTQDIITLRAKRFVEAHGEVGNHAMQDKAMTILEDLQQLATELRACYSGVKSQGGADLFRRLANYFDGDALESITSYELMSSGIVDVLLDLFNEPNQQAATEARSDFLEVFMATPNSSNLATGDAKSPSTAFSSLVHKLQDLLSRAEHFEVITVNQNAFESNRSSATSMLAKTIRLKLAADDDSGIPKSFRNIMVSIHAIATFSALDTYLRPRVNPDRPRRREGITGAMAAYAAAVSGRADRSGGLPPVPGLPSTGTSLPTRSGSKKPRSKSTKSEEAAQPETPKQGEPSGRLRRSSRKHSAQATADAPSEPEAPPAESAQPQETLDSQEGIGCADEERLSDDDEDDDIEADIDAIADELEEEEEFGRAAPDPSAVNIETGGSGKVTARTEDGARIGTPSGNTPVQTPTSRDRMSATARLLAAREMLSMPPGAAPVSSSRPMSYASALQAVPQDWHLEFSVDGQPIANDTTIYRACHQNTNQGDEFVGRSVWSTTHTIDFKKVPGPPSTDRTSTSPAPEQLNENGLPASLDKHPVTSGILRLMSILHDLNNNLEDVLAEHKSSVKLNAEPLSQFVNTKLTAKLNRQLEEPLIVASQCLPSWAEDLARLYPFLFPFETRHLFVQSTSFGYSRSMARWQGAQDANDSRRRHDDRPFLGRVQRQKVRISRNRILESAIKVMELYGQSSSILEVEYFEEVGTGLGPTLEFYSNVSKEFSRKKTKLWRENESYDAGEYAFGRRGLFPAPMSEEMAGDSNGQKVLHLFKMLGKFVARSMLDSRIIDVSFNPTFFRIGDGKSAVTPSLGAVSTVDQDLARSLKMLKKYAAAKQRIDEDGRLSAAKKVLKIDEIRINDARIEDLSLDFTLPGYPNIELVPGGSRTTVTIDNVGDYIKHVIDFTLGSGVQRQVDAFRAGFSQVFPYSSLRAFTPDELVMLFGRVEEDWSLETLMDSIKADHGYNLDSKSVRNLLQTMSELPPQSRRDFLQFITGSPKLPIGGFKSLTPMFTVVCKPSEPPFGPDDYLPSVMTCVNYLKMPDYSTLEVLKKKLGVAIKEGQGAFHLS